MINLFWPVYENLENTFNDLTHSIHFSDKQKHVFSSTIIDLVLRASSEIESISKELYKIHGGSEKTYLKFDEDCIKYLNSKFNLASKEVYISHPNCFFTENTVIPFRKNVQRSTSDKRMDFGWNAAYQNLKHNRVEAIEYGSIQNLIDIFAALFLLNIYFIDKAYDVDRLHEPTNFDRKLGSKIFSVNLSNSAGVIIDGTFPKNHDFDKSVYLIKVKNEDYSSLVDFCRTQDDKISQAISSDKRFVSALKKLAIPPEEINSKFGIILREANIDFRDFLHIGSSKLPSMRYEAVLNKYKADESPYTDGYSSWTGMRGIATQDSKPGM